MICIINQSDPVFDEAFGIGSGDVYVLAEGVILGLYLLTSAQLTGQLYHILHVLIIEGVAVGTKMTCIELGDTLTAHLGYHLFARG